MEKTLLIVKPDAVEANLAGSILAAIESAGFRISALEMRQLDHEIAAEHYAEHSERPFFGELVEFITRSPVVLARLEAPDCVAAFRQLAGATNPEDAEEGTLRKRFGTSLQENAVHGSDSLQSANRELALFFGK